MTRVGLGLQEVVEEGDKFLGEQDRDQCEREAITSVAKYKELSKKLSNKDKKYFNTTF